MAWPLLQEHGYLGASIEDGRVVSYLNETPLTEALEGVALFDLTGACYRFISGAGAQSLVEAFAASRRLAPGSCSFSAVLSGDGSVVSVPIIVRGGEHEYVLVDPTTRRDVLGGWLSFVSAIERDGAPAFGDVSIEDASSLLVPLMVAGSRCRELISRVDGRLMAVGSLGDTASMVMRKTEMRGMSKPMRSVCTRRFPSEGRMRGWSVLT